MKQNSTLSEFQKVLRKLEGKADFFPLARHLVALHEQHPHEFRECIRKAGIKQRRAYYLLELVDKLKLLNSPEERLLNIGWTKLQVITNGLTRGNAKQRLRLAENNTVTNLKRLLFDPESHEKTKWVQIQLSKKDYELFAKTILKFGARQSKSRHGLAGMEKALMKIIRQVK